MNLSRQKWYVWWFLWSAGIWDKFLGRECRYDYHYIDRGTNLCFFLRVMLIWTPLVLLLHLALAAGAVYVLVISPIHFFGLLKYGSTIGILVAVVMFLVGFFAVSRWLSKRVPAETTHRKEESQPSFLSLAWAGIVAKKRKICPLISFRDEERAR